MISQNYGKLCDRASELFGQDSLQLAEEVIRQALKLEPANPHNALLFSNLGTIQRRQRQYDDAIDSYTYALNIAPLSVPILLNRAALYLEQGKDNFAQVDYSLILDREKNNKEALQMRAYIYMDQSLLLSVILRMRITKQLTEVGLMKNLSSVPKNLN